MCEVNSNDQLRKTSIASRLKFSRSAGVMMGIDPEILLHSSWRKWEGNSRLKNWKRIHVFGEQGY